MTELELIVVDFGDCCAIQTTKGHLSSVRLPHGGFWGCNQRAGCRPSTIIFTYPFNDLREGLAAALDGGEKPERTYVLWERVASDPVNIWRFTAK